MKLSSATVPSYDTLHKIQSIFKTFPERPLNSNAENQFFLYLLYIIIILSKLQNIL